MATSTPPNSPLTPLRRITGRLVSDVPAAPRSAACLNCATPLTGPFCASCGQRDVPPYPSVRDLVVDAFWELSGWDGRFASTVRALVGRPGLLTREFLEGRRARYISPLRLYLMASLAFFLVAAAAPDVRRTSGTGVQLSGVVRTDDRDTRAAASVAVTPPMQPAPSTPAATPSASRPEQVAEAASQALDSKKPLTDEERAAVLQQIQNAPPLMRPFLRRVITDPAGFKSGVVQTMPRMLFALLPVFAVIVALFYRGRKYPEHLYFALHLHAFIFLALTAVEVLKFTRVTSLVTAAAMVALTSVAVYATMAFRNAYGGTIVRTLVKETAIATIYGATAIVGFIVMIYWVSVVG